MQYVLNLQQLIEARKLSEDTQRHFTVGFGKHIKKLVSQVPQEYVDWAKQCLEEM